MEYEAKSKPISAKKELSLKTVRHGCAASIEWRGYGVRRGSRRGASANFDWPTRLVTPRPHHPIFYAGLSKPIIPIRSG